MTANIMKSFRFVNTMKNSSKIRPLKWGAIVLAFVLISHPSLACEDLMTGTVVIDKHRNGKVKTLKTITSIQNSYGDSAPLYNILISKATLESKKWDLQKLNLAIAVKTGKLELQKETFKDLALWSEDSEFYSFTQFDKEKFSSKINSLMENQNKKLTPTTIELSLSLDQKEICKQKLTIDSH